MSDCSIPETYDDGSDSYTDYSTDSSTESWDSFSTTTMQIDSDQDGFAETTAIDVNADGIADAYDSINPETGAEHITLDMDGDGLLDTVISDFDGDGTFEAASQDTDGDGQLDTTLDPETGEPMDSVDTTETETTDPFAPFDDGSIDVEPVDTTDTDDGVHGDPMAEIPYHQAQVGPNDCLPTSVAMVITEATGTEVDQAELVDLTNELGLLQEDGMSMEGGLQLLEHYGIEAEVQTGSMDQLRDMLDANTPVIIGLDSDDLYGVGDQPFADDFVAGHAVVITGIDDEAGLVYINDPGFPDGAGVAIPIEQFEDAWQDGDHMMIVAEAGQASDSVDGSSAEDEALTSAGNAGNASDRVEDIPGLHDEDEGVLGRLADIVLLPINLIVR